MKVCLVSTSMNQSTGYSKVSYNMLRELKDTVEVFHYSTQSSKTGFRPPLDIAVKDHAFGEDNEYGFEGLREYVEENKIDIVVIYNDIAVTLSYLKVWSPPRLWVYLDTVCHGIPPQLLKMLEERAERIYLFNSYWKQVYDFASARVLEHGVDTDIFKPLPKENNDKLRAKLNIPTDATIFFNCNRNSRRKRLDLTISAFVQYCKRNPSVNAYLLMMVNSNGYYNIGNVLYNEIRKHKYDCSKKVMTIQTDKQLFTDVNINEFYNIADYGLNTSTGEGYGLTAVEHLAVGKPQILTHLPVYDVILPKDSVVYVEPLPDREYYEQKEFSGAYIDTWSALDIAIAMEKAVDVKVDYKPKSWKEVMTGFIADLTSVQSLEITEHA